MSIMLMKNKDMYHIYIYKTNKANKEFEDKEFEDSIYIFHKLSLKNILRT